jgi:hypothetical protein
VTQGDFDNGYLTVSWYLEVESHLREGTYTPDVDHISDYYRSPRRY